jgi:hypothetical protein
MVKLEFIRDKENPRYRVTTALSQEFVSGIFRSHLLRWYTLREANPKGICNTTVIVPEQEARAAGFARLITLLAECESE